MNKLDRIKEKIEEKYGDTVTVEFGDNPIYVNKRVVDVIEPILQEVFLFQVGEHIKLTFDDYKKCHVARSVFEDCKKRYKYKTLIVSQRKKVLYIIKRFNE